MPECPGSAPTSPCSTTSTTFSTGSRPRPPDGFAGVEYLFPYAYPKEELAERLRRHGLTQVLHNLPAGDWAGGERGIACLPGREGEFRAGVAKAIEYATALGCKQVNCLAGMAPAERPAGRAAPHLRRKPALRRA